MYNLSGGFKGWQGEAAFGSKETGLTLFTGDESPEKTLTVAYSLEDGLRDFYLSMILRVKNDDVKNIFKKLAEIEIVIKTAFLTNMSKSPEKQRTVRNLKKPRSRMLPKAVSPPRSISTFSNRRTGNRKATLSVWQCLLKPRPSTFTCAPLKGAAIPRVKRC